MKKLKKALLLTLALLLFASPTLVQAATIKINKTKSTIYTGATIQLKITGTKSKVKWKTSNKNIATVTQKGKVSAKKAGKATITATVDKKNYKSNVEVVKVNYKDNINKLKEYINKNGSTTLKGCKVIVWLNEFNDNQGDPIRVCDNGNLELDSWGAVPIYEPASVKNYKGTITLTINPDDIANTILTASVGYKDSKEVIKLETTIDIATLTKNNKISFGIDRNDELNEILDEALSRWNQFILEEVGMGLNDIGFESCELPRS